MNNEKKGISKLFAYAYGLGEFGFTFFNFLVAYYLMFYLTNVLQIPMVIAATLYSVIQWFEVFTMLAAGVVIDRTRLKNGQYRPWVVIGSIICAVNCFLFYHDFGFGDTMAVAFFSVTYFLCYCGFNMMWVGYRTLLNPLSATPKDGVKITTAASQLSSLAGLIFSLGGSKLLYGFENIKTGFTVCSIICGIVMVGAMTTVYFIVGPYDVQTKKPEEEKITFKELAKGINKYTVVYFLAVTFREATSTIFPTLLVYYFNYTVGNPDWMTYYSTTITLTTLLGQNFADGLASKFGKKRMFVVSSLIACVSLVCINLTGKSLVAFLSCVVVYYICAIFSGTMIPAFMNDIAVFNEANYGLRGHAFNTAIGGGALRLSQVLGGSLASFGLLLIGYNGSGEMAPAVSSKIGILMTVGSAVVSLVGTLIFTFYKIDDKALEEAYRKQAEKKAAEALNAAE